MLRAWLQPPEPMWKLLNWRRAAGGGGGREERRKGVGDGLLRVASCQPGNSANSWERAVCVCEFPFSPAALSPRTRPGALRCFENPLRGRHQLELLGLNG